MRETLTLSDAEDMVDQMAYYHAAFWSDPRLTRELSRLPTSELFQQRLNKIGLDHGTRIGIERGRSAIPPVLYRRKHEIFSIAMRSLHINTMSTLTVLHQDVHQGNWLRDPEGRMRLYDWQAVAKGDWGLDYSPHSPQPSGRRPARMGARAAPALPLAARRRRRHKPTRMRPSVAALTPTAIPRPDLGTRHRRRRILPSPPATQGVHASLPRANRAVRRRPRIAKQPHVTAIAIRRSPGCRCRAVAIPAINSTLRLSGLQKSRRSQGRANSAVGERPVDSPLRAAEARSSGCVT